MKFVFLPTLVYGAIQSVPINKLNSEEPLVFGRMGYPEKRNLLRNLQNVDYESDIKKMMNYCKDRDDYCEEEEVKCSCRSSSMKKCVRRKVNRRTLNRNSDRDFVRDQYMKKLEAKLKKLKILKLSSFC